MPKLLGEYEVKADTKGRLRLPSHLIKQMGEAANNSFVLNRGIDKCIVLYTTDVWQEESAKIDALNPYIGDNRRFQRFFYRGATELQKDSNDRINLPKRLMEYAGIHKDVVLNAYNNKVEIWSLEKFEIAMEEELKEDFSSLAEKVMGNSSE